MKPKVKVTLTVFTFAAMVLTGLAAAEQLPKEPPKGNDPIISPNIISLSPKLMRRKDQFEKDGKMIRAQDSVLLQPQATK